MLSLKFPPSPFPLKRTMGIFLWSSSLEIFRSVVFLDFTIIYVVSYLIIPYFRRKLAVIRCIFLLLIKDFFKKIVGVFCPMLLDGLKRYALKWIARGTSTEGTPSIIRWFLSLQPFGNRKGFLPSWRDCGVMCRPWQWNMWYSFFENKVWDS